ncbi:MULTISPECIES: lipoprotein-releasing ABC transporter permease subunit [unclassified Salinivibrio]|uniref:lipoprotein-releasing ABC transporter permease subunit n=1 Tax=unclassified Salinivibrio TaxID=2636825 RepID=UPI00128D9F68|nr:MULTISPECIES: lipoprotein-releasing ABC transporter permease subunit [unclassified Salinivibrio]MPS31488.1 lipoprotein-releasing ABC transporter permease subunit [Salinivibrio sp. VYel7]MPX92883.1 lipoprotein-releasing ABC transporter permease subunit [Salinivibrio sp. VYel9]MPX95433.1 lipoprotein-releasing ABC transporter permease subunit [Salinivibrio sp. VYel6]MPX99101.1 lipoprotein-releasing ABC transporter permease subunit [Salinivibrio sp. VYel4]MPY02192.1 lipoprotein-releasing ABC tr
MFQPLSVFIGLRYLRGRSADRFGRFVSSMSTAGIAIGVMALITVSSVMNGFEAQLKGRILGVLPHAIIANGQANPDQTAIERWPHVIDTAPIQTTDAVIQSRKGLSAGLLEGIDPSAHEPLASHLLQGELSALAAGRYQVIIGRSMATELQLRVGDAVRVMVTSASRFTPIGRIPAQRLFTVAGIFHTGTDVDGQLMLANIDDVARLSGVSPSQANDLRLFLDDPFAITQLKTHADPDTWTDWRVWRGELFQAVKMEKNMMSLMLSLIVIVAAFNIISALIMVVMEKQSEVAILKTLGMQDKDIVAVFIAQGSLSGVLGAAVGGVLGVLLSAYINEIMSIFGVSLLGNGLALPVVINPFHVAMVLGLAVVLSVLATLFPAFKAASVHPAEALRYE